MLQLHRDPQEGIWFCTTDGPADRFPAKAAGLYWDPKGVRWWTKDDDRALRLREFATDEARAILDEVAAARVKSSELSRATESDIELPVPDGLSYLPYQAAGIEGLLNRPSALLADEMGLGKTIQAIGLVNADDSVKTVLVICPASLKLNWAREIVKWSTREALVSVASGGKVALYSVPSEKAQVSYLIINYDILGRHRASLRDGTWDLLVCDEAHYLKNGQAQRTGEVFGRSRRRGEWIRSHVKSIVKGDASLADRAFDLAEAECEARFGKGSWVQDPAPIESRRTVLLTGTPILNKPKESYTLLRRCDPEKWKSFRHFAIRYCAGGDGRYGFEADGESNLEELQDILRSTIMIRRRKADVLKDLPAKRRQVIEVPANGLSKVVARESKVVEGHESNLASLRAAVAIAEVSDDPEAYSAALSRLREAEKVAFTEISRVRHETAVAKIPIVISHLRDAIDSSGKVVVFCHHRDVVDELERAFPNSAIITGSTPASQRQGIVDRFQNDPNCELFIGNLKAAGVGITLTAASHVVFAELDWVPANLSQAEDRCHRIGQEASVLVQHLVLEGSLDARMASKIVQKQAISDRALDRETDGSGVVPEAIPFSEAPPAPDPSPAPKRGEVKLTDRQKKLAELADTLSQENVESIHQGLKILSGVCDGAHELDGQGFSALDTNIGKDLAARDRLTPKQAALGQGLCRKYRRQLDDELLAACGLEVK